MSHPVTKFLLSCVAAAPLTMGAVTAQCAFSSLAMNSFGQGCTPVFAVSPSLSGSLDVNTCSLGLTVNAFSGCCNTYLTGRALAIGLQQNNQPLPILGANCTLWVQPDAVLYLPASGGDTFTLQLPTGFQPSLTFYAQGAALYFTTIGFTNDASLTDGHSVTLQ